MLGLSSTRWGGYDLPLDLSFLGMSGCLLLTSIDDIVSLLPNGGRAQWDLSIPAIQSLVGLSFYQQAFVVDPAANLLGATVSNAGHGTMGRR